MNFDVENFYPSISIDLFTDAISYAKTITNIDDDQLLIIGIYHKHTQTGQYVSFDSFTLWKWKISWIISLVTRAKRICSESYLDQEIQLIKNYAAWNGYPKHIVNSIVKRALRDKESNNTKEETTTDAVKIFIDLKVFR